ncbi:MAG TPA: hypothetical protein HA362_04535 [Nanoarchaeota archaeon]|nr:hypothetical protein [Nanoarchaeota archaeon]
MKKIVFDSDADGIFAAYIWLAENNPASYSLCPVPVGEAAPVADDNSDEVVLIDKSATQSLELIMHELEKGKHVSVVDHHVAPGNLREKGVDIADVDKKHCTASYLNERHGNKYRTLASIASVADNVAVRNELTQGMAEEDIGRFRCIGELLKYNGMGKHVVSPAVLLSRLCDANGNLDEFMASSEIGLIAEKYNAAMEKLEPALTEASTNIEPVNVVLLPEGEDYQKLFPVCATRLQEMYPQCTHLVMVPAAGGGYSTSIRAPKDASRIAALFGGSGRATSAGARIYLDKCGGIEGVKAMIREELKNGTN